MILTSLDSLGTTEGSRLLLRGKWTKMDGTAPVAVIFHDYNRRSVDALNPSLPEYTLATWLAEAGYVVVLSDLFGNVMWRWDNINDAMQEVADAACQLAGYAEFDEVRNGYLKTYIETAEKAITLGAVGMGAIAAFEEATTDPDFNSFVSSIVMFQPMVDLATAAAEAIYSDSVNTAFAAHYSDAVFGSGYNPYYQMTHSASTYAGLLPPIQIVYGASASPSTAPALIESFIAMCREAGGLIDTYNQDSPDLIHPYTSTALIDFVNSHTTGGAGSGGPGR